MLLVWMYEREILKYYRDVIKDSELMQFSKVDQFLASLLSVNKFLQIVFCNSQKSLLTKMFIQCVLFTHQQEKE